MPWWHRSVSQSTFSFFPCWYLSLDYIFSMGHDKLTEYHENQAHNLVNFNLNNFLFLFKISHGNKRKRHGGEHDMTDTHDGISAALKRFAEYHHNRIGQIESGLAIVLQGRSQQDGDFQQTFCWSPEICWPSACSGEGSCIGKTVSTSWKFVAAVVACTSTSREQQGWVNRSPRLTTALCIVISHHLRVFALEIWTPAIVTLLQ